LILQLALLGAFGHHLPSNRSHGWEIPHFNGPGTIAERQASRAMQAQQSYEDQLMRATMEEEVLFSSIDSSVELWSHLGFQ